MKIYKLEFQYFDGANWKMTEKEIYASSLFQLMRTFLNETYSLHDTMYCPIKNEIRYKTPKDLWNENKKYIEEIKLPFVIEL